MTRAPLHEVLKAVPIFAELDDRALQAITATACTQEYPKGRVIIREGNPGQAFYLLLDGAVKVLRMGPHGHDVIRGWLQPGEWFGDLALVDGRPQLADVRATKKSTVVILHKGAFLSLLQTSSAFLHTYLTGLCQHVRDADDRVVDLGWLAVDQQIDKALLWLGRKVGVPGEAGTLVIAQRPTHQELADLIGTSRETVTRRFKKLEHQGDLGLRGRTVVLRKTFLERLERGAE